MKVPNIFLLLFCIDAVGVLLFAPAEVSTAPVDHEDAQGYSGVNKDKGAQQNDSDRAISVTTLSLLPNSNSTTEVTTSKSAESSFHTTGSSVVIPKTPSPLRKANYATLLMVAGALIIACVILLVSTVMLAMKVCQMRRHIKTSDAILISKSECPTDAAGSTAETEAKETTVLMNDIGQTQVGDGAPEDEDKHKDGQTGKEGGEKQDSNSANCTKALATENQEMPPAAAAAESAASPTPLGGTTNSPPTNTNADPSTEALKESKEE